MSWFNKHKHNWKEIARTYSEPARLGSINATGLFPNEYAKLLENLVLAAQGKTTILWECSECQATRKEEMAGTSVQGEKS